jgi:diaminopimelate decarboxylase
VLYVKKGRGREFVILDAGMNDLIRPALYQAKHKLQNLSSVLDDQLYDVVGPVCESSDSFGTDVSLPETSRGDIFAIRSAGAYGQVMSTRYNQRDLAPEYYSE